MTVTSSLRRESVESEFVVQSISQDEKYDAVRELRNTLCAQRARCTPPLPLRNLTHGQLNRIRMLPLSIRVDPQPVKCLPELRMSS